MFPGFTYGRSLRHGVAPSRFRSALLVLGIALVLLTTDLHAQTATVTGTIRHSNGSAAVNVLVWVSGQYRYSDLAGRYRIPNVPVGTQHMIIRIGQHVLWQGNVNIVAPTTTIDKRIP